jgi:hypothetical protein
VKAAGAQTSLARSELLRSLTEARDVGLLPLEYDAQLAMGEIELRENSAAGKANLELLQKRAHEHGLELVARKAAAIRMDQAQIKR